MFSPDEEFVFPGLVGRSCHFDVTACASGWPFALEGPAGWTKYPTSTCIWAFFGKLTALLLFRDAEVQQLNSAQNYFLLSNSTFFRVHRTQLNITIEKKKLFIFFRLGHTEVLFFEEKSDAKQPKNLLCRNWPICTVHTLFLSLSKVAICYGFPLDPIKRNFESCEAEVMVTGGRALASRRSIWELTLFPGVTIPPPVHQIRSDRKRCGCHQGGRGWLAFGNRKIIPESFCRASICKFSRMTFV